MSDQWPEASEFCVICGRRGTNHESCNIALARIQELEVENARLRAKIEWAAHACINEMVDADETGQESDFAYNRACEDCAAAVLKGKPLESPAPTPEPREGGE